MDASTNYLVLGFLGVINFAIVIAMARYAAPQILSTLLHKNDKIIFSDDNDDGDDDTDTDRNTITATIGSIN